MDIKHETHCGCESGTYRVGRFLRAHCSCPLIALTALSEKRQLDRRKSVYLYERQQSILGRRMGVSVFHVLGNTLYTLVHYLRQQQQIKYER